MILLLMQEKNLQKKFNDLLVRINEPYKLITKKNSQITYQNKVERISLIVLSPSYYNDSNKAWHKKLSQKKGIIPVVIYSPRQTKIENVPKWINEIKTTKQLKKYIPGYKKKILDISEDTLKDVLVKNQNTISMLFINTKNFQRVADEYGSQTYEALNSYFEKILLELWGQKDGFRSLDYVLKRSDNRGSYYLILGSDRSGLYKPKPGQLEKICDRLTTKIKNKIWQEVNSRKADKILPNNFREVPLFSMGYAESSVDKRNNDSYLFLQNLIEECEKTEKIQKQRQLIRLKEFINFLIEIKDLLYSSYQGIFDVKFLNKKSIETAKKQNSLLPIKECIYGFEALLRVNSNKANEILKDNQVIQTKYLSPDILFFLAKQVDLDLDLDKSGLKNGLKHHKILPGKIFLNILPRNYYNLKKIKFITPNKKNIIFEISETEIIKNYKQFLDTQSKLTPELKIIAIDDFGIGYSGFDRVLKTSPKYIKIDRTLINSIDKDKIKQKFVEGIVKACKIKKVKTIAEGVESYLEFLTVKKLKIDFVQGFLLHKPETGSEIKLKLK